MPKRGIGGISLRLRENLARSTGLPFRELLTEEELSCLVAELGVGLRDHLYTPVVTVLAFVAQILSDGSCRQAVGRVIATLVTEKQEAPSSNTSAYCQARGKLPESFFKGCLDKTSGKLEERADAKDLWLKRHRVLVVDGSSAQMPDTAENRAEFGLPSGVKAGCGLPIIFFVGIFSLATGVLRRLVIGAKGAHERHLFREGWDVFSPGDVALGDRGFCSYADIAQLQERGVHSVFRIFNRKPDFREGERLCKEDHIVTWIKPLICPRGMSEEEFKALPETLTVRELRIRIQCKGFRSQLVLLVTTFLDTKIYTKEVLADLYRRRWEAELDFRHIKTTLGMELLATKSPEMIRKEIHTYLIAYNLIRTLMWEAGCRYEIDPLRISLKGTLDHLILFASHLATATEAEHTRLVQELLHLMARDIVPYRPNRVEPRVVKRRPKNYRRMTKPRQALKKALLA